MLTLVFHPSAHPLVAALVIHTVLALGAHAGEWIKDASTGCLIWNPAPFPGERVTWNGPCRDGKARLLGELVWTLNGKVIQSYEGFMENGRPDGRGKYSYQGGSSYSGHFKNGEYDGQGQHTHADGSWYKGAFRAGRRNGYGERSFPAENTTFFGRFYDDEVIGCGVLRDHAGTNFVWLSQKWKSNVVATSSLDYQGIGQCRAEVFEYYWLNTPRGDIKAPRFTNGATILHAVADHGDFDAMETLLRLGLDPNATNDHGERPLHLVAGRDHDEVSLAALLIANRALLDVQTRYGSSTPLRLAVMHENIEICRLLLKSGASVNLGEKSLAGGYQMPLDDARYTENPELIRLIESYGGRSGRERSIAPDIAKLIVLAGAVALAAAIVNDTKRQPESAKPSDSSRSRSQAPASGVPWHLAAGTYQFRWRCTRGLNCKDSPETSITLTAPNWDAAYRIGMENARAHCKQLPPSNEPGALWCSTEMSPAGESCSRVK